ncbi:hypothetical protein ACJBU6_07559 [Exserohilum turcicum]
MSNNTDYFTNPKNHPDNAHLPTLNQPATILGITIAFLGVAILTVCLRLWVRLKDRLWGWDDFFVVLAAIASFVGDIMVCRMPKDGLGLHLWTLDWTHLVNYFKHIYSTNAAYAASSTLIKLSILFQYLRLFAETAPSTSTRIYHLSRRLTWGMIAVCSAWGLTFFPLALFSCRPIAKNWDPLVPGKCIGWGSKDPEEFFAMFLGHAVSNSVLDILVLLLPVPFMTALRIAGKSRAGLIGLFIMGSSAVVVAIGRIIALSVNRAGTVPVIDMSFYTPLVYIFAVLEVNFAIITASIPIFWPAIATLASNKIFVVNEVEIRVEDVTRHESFDSNGGISLNDRKSTPSGENKMGVVTRVSDHITRKSGEKLSLSTHDRKPSKGSLSVRSAGLGHTGRSPSNASSIGNSFADFGTRPSQDSLHHLYRTCSRENQSSKSLTREDSDDWFAEMDRANARAQATSAPTSPLPFENMKPSDTK